MLGVAVLLVVGAGIAIIVALRGNGAASPGTSSGVPTPSDSLSTACTPLASCPVNNASSTSSHTTWIVVGFCVLAAAALAGAVAVLLRRRRPVIGPAAHLPANQTQGAPETLYGRIGLGSAAIRLNSDSPGLDDDVLVWFSANAAFVFDFVRVVCRFDPGDGETIEQASIKAVLQAPDPRSQAVVWSMSPKRLVTGQSLKTTTTIEADLKLFDVTHSRENTGGERVLLEGDGELSSSARWQVFPESRHGLAGDREVRLIVRRDANAQINCTFEVGIRLRFSGHAVYYNALTEPNPDQPGQSGHSLRLV